LTKHHLDYFLFFLANNRKSLQRENILKKKKRQKKSIPAPIQIKQVPEQPEDLDLHFYLIQMPF